LYYRKFISGRETLNSVELTKNIDVCVHLCMSTSRSVFLPAVCESRLKRSARSVNCTQYNPQVCRLDLFLTIILLSLLLGTLL